MRIKFVNLISESPEKLAEFYQKALGASVASPVSHRYELSWGETNAGIAITKCEKREPLDCFIEFDTDEIDALYKRISEQGFDIVEPIKDLPWGYRYFVVRDTDGNTVDVTQKL
jgi:uncharacterized glyoxalase superfamily protein PhnB